MRLVIVICSMAGGGAERVTANLANYWARKGWEISVVTLVSLSLDSYELHPSVKRIGLDLAGNSGNVLVGLWQNLRRLFAIRRVLRQIQPDIALGMMSSANVLLAFASWRLTQIRTVGSERTYPPEYPLGVLWEMLRSYSYGFLGAMVAQTNESAEWIKSHTSSQRVAVIPNPVVWPLTNQMPRLDMKEVCSEDKNLLLAVGRLSSEKQFGLLVDCFRLLSSRHPDWNLAILGEGPLRPALEKQILDLGLGKRIFLLGRAGNVGECYEIADLYVMNSRFEGFPNTLIEAMAYGLPAVSFDCDTGPRNIIRHEIDGLLVPVGDVVALATALDRLMGDKELRTRFSANAVEVREKFSIEKVVGLWEQLFDEVLDEQRQF